MKLLYFIRDPYPTSRPDVLTLFGHCLKARGTNSDLVGTRHGDLAASTMGWPAGAAFVYVPAGGAMMRHVGSFLHDLSMLRRASRYDAVLVRDKILTASAALLWPHRRPVHYWASFPFPEDDLARSALPGRGHLRRAGLRLRGRLTRWLLYRFVVPRATRVFVQSERMRDVFAASSGRTAGLHEIPMGVDARALPPAALRAALHVPGETFRLVYLGSLDRARRIEFLLDTLLMLRERDPATRYQLMLIGGASTPAEFDWLADRVRASGVAEVVEMTGPMSREQAWARAAQCHLGLSAIPRGPVYDVSSPTKTVEYLALGLPVLVNDIPDQLSLVRQTGAGLCVTMNAGDFADAIVNMRGRHAEFRARAEAARGWLLDHRGYELLADRVMAVLAASRTTQS